MHNATTVMKVLKNKWVRPFYPHAQLGRVSQNVMLKNWRYRYRHRVFYPYVGPHCPDHWGQRSWPPCGLSDSSLECQKMTHANILRIDSKPTVRAQFLKLNKGEN